MRPRCRPRGTDAAFAAIGNGRQLAKDLLAIYEAWSEFITARRTAAVWRLLPMLLSHPAVTSAVVQEATGLSQPAADNVIGVPRSCGTVGPKTDTGNGSAWSSRTVCATEGASLCIRRQPRGAVVPRSWRRLREVACVLPS